MKIDFNIKIMAFFFLFLYFAECYADCAADQQIGDDSPPSSQQQNNEPLIKGNFINPFLVSFELKTIPTQSIQKVIKSQLQKQQCNCNNRQGIANQIAITGDNVFMRYPKLFPNTISEEIIILFTAGHIAQSFAKRKARFNRVIALSKNPLITYRAILQILLDSFKLNIKQEIHNVPKLIQQARKLKITGKNKALILSDLAFIEAFYAFSVDRHLDRAEERVNHAIASDKNMLAAYFLQTEIRLKKFQQQKYYLSASACIQTVNKLVSSIKHIVDLQICPLQAISFANELDGWSNYSNAVKLIPVIYLYKLAGKNHYLRKKYSPQYIKQHLQGINQHCQTHMRNLSQSIIKLEK